MLKITVRSLKKHLEALHSSHGDVRLHLSKNIFVWRDEDEFFLSSEKDNEWLQELGEVLNYGTKDQELCLNRMMQFAHAAMLLNDAQWNWVATLDLPSALQRIERFQSHPLDEYIQLS